MSSPARRNKLIVAGIIVALIVAVVLLQRGCGMIGDDVSSPSGSGDSDSVAMKVPDTVFVDAVADTVYICDTIRLVINNPVPYEVYIDTTDQHSRVVDCDSTRMYVNSFVDSAGSVEVSSKVRGEIVEQGVEMSLRTVMISNIDTVRIEIPCPDKKERAVWSVGGAFNSAIEPIIWGTVQNKNRSIIGGYNFVDGRVMFGAGIVFK